MGDGESRRERNRVIKGEIEDELRKLEDEISACKRVHTLTHTMTDTCTHTQRDTYTQ